jgi:fluoride exporter
VSRLLLICLAGAAGTALRYGLGLVAVRLAGPELPLGTLAVNLLGCLAMGAVAERASQGGLDETLRLALTTGLLGGFTTYSAFNLELTRLGAQRPALAALYGAATVVGCLGAGVVGAAVVRALSSRG